jgi:hypothetical protein
MEQWYFEVGPLIMATAEGLHLPWSPLAMRFEIASMLSCLVCLWSKCCRPLFVFLA